MTPSAGEKSNILFATPRAYVRTKNLDNSSGQRNDTNHEIKENSNNDSW